MRVMKRATRLILIILILILAETVKLYAQIGECGDTTDPDHPDCPLDTWVYVLVFAATLFAILHLYRRQRPSPNSA